MGALRLGWPTWIGIVAEDLEAQRRFYRDVLGLSESASGDGWVAFDMGSGQKLELLAKQDAPQYDRPRFQAGFSVDDIDAAFAELQERGVEQVSEIERAEDEGMSWCYFRDAEGNVFEVAQRF